MKHLFLLVATCLAFSTSSVAQNSIKIWVDEHEKEEITTTKLLHDLNEYKNAIVQHHINPFAYISKAEFCNAIDSLIAQGDKCDIDELLIGQMKVNARIGDHNTGLRYAVLNRFPLVGYCFKEGVYIILTDEDNSKYMLSKVLAIDGMPIEKVLERLSTIVPGNNKSLISDYVNRNLFNPYVLHGLRITKSRSVKYTLLTQQNDTVTITPKAYEEKVMTTTNGMNSDRFFRNTHKDSYYWFTDTGKAIYFKYGACISDPGEPFEDVSAALIKKIDEMNPDKIIIDIRENYFGSSAQLTDIITYLCHSKLNRKGGIYVLIGRRTFSSAVLNAIELKTNTNAIMVGEETGEAVNHCGEIKNYLLPHTHISLSYSTKTFTPIKNYEGALKPDVVIEETFADYKNGVDAALQYAMTH